MSEWKIKIIDVGYKIARDVYVFREIGGGSEFIKNDGTTEFMPYASAVQPNPTFSLSPEALQELSDELYRTGYKPEKGYEKGKLEATENHLKDLQSLLKLKK